MVAPSAPRARVLFLSGLQIHPARSGGNLRSRSLVSALQRHGFDVFVYSLVGRKADYLSLRPSSVESWPEGTEEHVDRGWLGFLAQYGSYALGLPPIWISSFLAAAAASPGELLLPKALRRRLAWSDIVLVDFPFPYPVFASRSARGRLHVVSTHNVEHHLLDGSTGRLGRWLRERVRSIELAAAATSDVLVACSSADQAYFEQNARVKQSVLVPNGIDLQRFHGSEGLRDATRRALGVADEARLFLFTASKWGPNREAFDYLVALAGSQSELLLRHRIHILVVGSVVATPLSVPGLTATGVVDEVERYFAAADAALNPITSGAGTSVKMAEFIAARLPILTTPFGARGFRIEEGRSGFLFERDTLAERLLHVRRLFDEDPSCLRRIAATAYSDNESAIDMNASVQALADALRAARSASLAPSAV